VFTSADEAAARDMCLDMVRRDHGSAVTWHTPEPPLPDVGGTSIRAAQAWALEHLHCPVSLAEFAERAALNVRTFRRQFLAEVGMPPLQWLIQQRIDRARRLLAETDLSVEQVAARTGFGSHANLRTQFSRHVGLTPSTYRAMHRTPVR
jgi:transcriptional regulator GlxA family with amidase domain